MDNINFSGSIERFLKGDADPINIFGLSPSRADLRANKADRGRRATQISFEQGSESLRKAGGSIDDPTKQVKKLKESKTHLSALSPFNPVPLPSVTITAGITEAGIRDKKKKTGERRLAAKNKEHADTSLFFKRPAGEVRRLSDARMRQSILGRRL